MAPDKFMSATRSRYYAMKTRFAARYSKDGAKLLKPGREIPFSLEEYRVFMQNLSENGFQCEYCGRRLKIEDVSPDHRIPAKRGGSLALENIAVSCSLCNRRKGELTGEEFDALLRGLKTFPEYARNYILRALGSAAMGARMRFHPRAKKETPSGDPSDLST